MPVPLDPPSPFRSAALAAALCLAAGPLLASAPAARAEAAGLTARAVEEASFEGGPLGRALVAKLQILLDRRGFSPGVIDGYEGENVVKALTALEFAESLQPDGVLDADLWAALAPEDIAPVLVDYEITEADLEGPFLEQVPEDYRKLAELERIAYTGPLEMLAERFHMDRELLAELNPDKDFAKAGTVVVVADPGPPLEEPTVESIEVDGAAGGLRAFDAEGLLVAFYPATVGSKDNPGPSGEHQVRTVAIDPTYTYDPKINFVEDGIEERLVLPPGPNGPVGSVWIDLTEPTYGIHGTAEPAEVDKSWSHGCVRLTNWDARELAELVREGTKVVFLDPDSEAGTEAVGASGAKETAAQ